VAAHQSIAPPSNDLGRSDPAELIPLGPFFWKTRQSPDCKNDLKRLPFVQTSLREYQRVNINVLGGEKGPSDVTRRNTTVAK